MPKCDDCDAELVDKYHVGVFMHPATVEEEEAEHDPRCDCDECQDKAERAYEDEHCEEIQPMVFKTYEQAQMYRRCAHAAWFAAQLEVVPCLVYRTGIGWCHWTVVMGRK